MIYDFPVGQADTTSSKFGGSELREAVSIFPSWNFYKGSDKMSQFLSDLFYEGVYGIGIVANNVTKDIEVNKLSAIIESGGEKSHYVNFTETCLLNVSTLSNGDYDINVHILYTFEQTTILRMEILTAGSATTGLNIGTFNSLDDNITMVNIVEPRGLPDDLYSSISHNHDTDYSPTSHDHDADYSPISHNHDADYSPTSHDHNADYLSKTQDTSSTGAITAKQGTGKEVTLTENSVLLDRDEGSVRRVSMVAYNNGIAIDLYNEDSIMLNRLDINAYGEMYLNSELVLSEVDKNFGLNGYLELNNGLIIQWGSTALSSDTTTAGGETVTFPLAFPNVVFGVYPTMKDATVENPNLMVWHKNTTLSSFSLVTDSTESSATGTVKSNWFAIGY